MNLNLDNKTLILKINKEIKFSSSDFSEEETDKIFNFLKEAIKKYNLDFSIKPSVFMVKANEIPPELEELKINYKKDEVYNLPLTLKHLIVDSDENIDDLLDFLPEGLIRLTLIYRNKINLTKIPLSVRKIGVIKFYDLNLPEHVKILDINLMLSRYDFIDDRTLFDFENFKYLEKINVIGFHLSKLNTLELTRYFSRAFTEPIYLSDVKFMVKLAEKLNNLKRITFVSYVNFDEESNLKTSLNNFSQIKAEKYNNLNYFSPYFDIHFSLKNALNRALRHGNFYKFFLSKDT